MIVEYSTRFPFVSEIAVEEGEGRGGGMAETVGKISLQRRGGTFYDSSAPRSFTVESEQNSFYRVGRGRVEEEGGELLRCLRGAAVQGLENKTIVAMSPRVLILARNGGGVAICGDV